MFALIVEFDIGVGEYALILLRVIRNPDLRYHACVVDCVSPLEGLPSRPLCFCKQVIIVRRERPKVSTARIPWHSNSL